jgi:glycerol uptake facilitator-like aquaporin
MDWIIFIFTLIMGFIIIIIIIIIYRVKRNHINPKLSLLTVSYFMSTLTETANQFHCVTKSYQIPNIYIN